MTPQQATAFAQGAGFSAPHLSFLIKLMVGSVAVLMVITVLIGLTHLINGHSDYEKAMFFINLFALLFTLMLIFMLIA